MLYPDWDHVQLRGTTPESFRLDLRASIAKLLPNSEAVTVILEEQSERELPLPASGIVSGGKFASFANDVRLNPNDRLLVRRASPTVLRVSPLCEPLRLIDLCAGIGGIRLGFAAIGAVGVFASEIDAEAQVTYEANFGERPYGDLTTLHANDVPAHDLLVAGFPCQPFSIIGSRAGFADTRGTLYFEIERILHHHRPRAVLLENVKQFRTHDEGRTCQTVLRSLELLGYTTSVNVLNAIDYGVAQTRERTFIVGFQDPIAFSFPNPHRWHPSLNQILEPDSQIDPALIASPEIQTKRLERLRKQGKEPFYPSIWHENKGGHIGMHPYSCALRHNASYSYLLVNGQRRPTGREMLRLLGYPDTFQIPVKHSAIRAQAGNSVAVPVITAIAAR